METIPKKYQYNLKNVKKWLKSKDAKSVNLCFNYFDNLEKITKEKNEGKLPISKKEYKQLLKLFNSITDIFLIDVGVVRDTEPRVTKKKKVIAKWFECGSCRGASFSTSGKFDVNKAIKVFSSDNVEAQEDLYEDDNFPTYLFYNHSNDKGLHATILKVLRAIKRRKIVYEGWEEGTTGCSIKLSMKELKLEVKGYDSDSQRGMAVGNIDEIIKK